MKYEHAIIFNDKVFKVGDTIIITGVPENGYHNTYEGKIISLMLDYNNTDCDELQIRTKNKINGTYYHYFIISRIEKII